VSEEEKNRRDGNRLLSPAISPIRRKIGQGAGREVLSPDVNNDEGKERRFGGANPGAYATRASISLVAPHYDARQIVINNSEVAKMRRDSAARFSHADPTGKSPAVGKQSLMRVQWNLMERITDTRISRS